jgi:hypothetical protein
MRFFARGSGHRSGPIGLMGVGVAKALGAMPVILTGTRERRLEIGRRFKAGDHARLVEWLARQKVRAERALGRPLQLAVCYEVGYDGFWLARLLLKAGIRTVVFDPASFLKPRRGRWAFQQDRTSSGDCDVVRG